MKTLVIYDDSGSILMQRSGVYTTPEYVNFAEIEIPDGKIINGMDITTDIPAPIFIDLPKSDKERLLEQEKEIADITYLLMMGGII